MRADTGGIDPGACFSKRFSKQWFSSLWRSKTSKSMVLRKFDSLPSIEGTSRTHPFRHALPSRRCKIIGSREGPNLPKKTVSSGVHIRLHRCIKETQNMHDSSSKGLPTEPGPEPGPDPTRSRAADPDRTGPTLGVSPFFKRTCNNVDLCNQTTWWSQNQIVTPQNYQIKSRYTWPKTAENHGKNAQNWSKWRFPKSYGYPYSSV